MEELVRKYRLREILDKMPQGSVKKLARQIGVSPSTVTTWSGAKLDSKTNITDEHLDKLAAVLGVSKKDLYTIPPDNFLPADPIAADNPQLFEFGIKLSEQTSQKIDPIMQELGWVKQELSKIQQEREQERDQMKKGLDRIWELTTEFSALMVSMVQVNTELQKTIAAAKSVS